MKLIAIFVFAVLVSNASAVPDEPRAVAEAALTAFETGNAPALEKLAHSELKKRLRTARLLQFYLSMKKVNPGVLSSAADSKVVELFCEAHRAIVPPRDSRFEYFDNFVSTTTHENFAMVVFDSGWRLKTDPSSENHLRNTVILEKSGGNWLLLWSPEVNLHVDLDWDPSAALFPDSSGQGN